jgi:hypothetical protein
VGLSTDQGVRFQGFHGRVLIVIDEAPGVKADIWEAVEGIRAGGDVRVLALGNPRAAVHHRSTGEPPRARRHYIRSTRW